MEKVYIATRNFASHRHNGMEEQGTEIPYDSLSESTAKHLIRKGLITPSYKTKEDKRAAQVRKKTEIKRDTSQWYFVMVDGKVVDRVWKKQRAQKVADDIS